MTEISEVKAGFLKGITDERRPPSTNTESFHRRDTPSGMRLADVDDDALECGSLVTG
eukprot:m.268807 g.268807  ORF g.268807 m.268807 type:complete len:57 (-) comp26818_c0_seq1:1199-1369(-)